MSSSPSTSPVFTIHRVVKDAADSGDITNRDLGMNMQGYRSGVVRIVPSAAASPVIEVLFWSAEAGKFISRVYAIETGGFGAGVAFELPFNAFGGVVFVKVVSGVGSGDTVTILMAGSQLKVPESDVLLRFIDADVTQNTAGRYVWDSHNKVLHGPFNAGELAAFWLYGRKFGQIHEAWDETCGKSETFSAWGSSAGATITSDQITAPDPVKLADKLTFAAAAGDFIYLDKPLAASATDNTDQTLTIFVRTLTGTKNFRLVIRAKSGAISYSADLTATTTWQRFDFTVNILAGATGPRIYIFNDSGGAAGDIYIWGCNVYKDRSVPGPYMTNDSGADQTYAGDMVSWAADIVPAAIYSEKYATKLVPFWAHDEAPGAYLIVASGSTGDYLRYRPATDKFGVSDTEGGIVVESNAVTLARNTLLTITAGAPAGTLEVAGAASGNGEVSGTAWTWDSINDLVWGAYAAGMIGHINGRICEPYRPTP